ncbi:hypothetical protein VNO77_44450 [Canavalia gladiata]|uniref:Precursor of CEP14 n=1 Tax=Canavalia gladiata TaxID=3824 RepID=A0AAN9JX27_CANGL
MARLGSLLVLFLILCTCLEARKLHVGGDKHGKKVDPSSRKSLFFSSLPKGKVPSSTPSRKGHSIEVDEKLVARHLITTERLLLQSVPSPGAGH